jgi:hypothetical protein
MGESLSGAFDWISKLFSGGGGGAASALGSAGEIGDPFGGNTMAATPAFSGTLTADPLKGTGEIGDPFGGNTMNSSWWDRNKGDITKGIGAAQGALKGAGDVNKSTAEGAPKLGNPGQSQAIRGQGPNLNQLVQMLLQRQQGLYPGGGSSGQPQPAPRQAGLLGF